MIHETQAQPNERRYQFQTVQETFQRIARGTEPWVAVGDFLDDWRRATPDQRLELIEKGPGDPGNNVELQRWAAFCSAMVEWLCWNASIPFPPWTARPAYILPEPWFLYPGWRLRAWQLATTPTPFRMRNIFGGDHMLDRV